MSPIWGTERGWRLGLDRAMSSIWGTERAGDWVEPSYELNLGERKKRGAGKQVLLDFLE